MAQSQTADATSSGASEGSKVLLRTLIECGYRGRRLLPIVDAPAAQQAPASGVGATMRTCVGGALDTDQRSIYGVATFL